MPRFSGRSILREINYFQRYSLPYYSVPRCLPIPPFLRNILDKLARKGKKIKRRCPQTRYEIRSFSTWMQFPSILTRIIFRLVTRRANLPFIGRFSCNNGPGTTAIVPICDQIRADVFKTRDRKRITARPFYHSRGGKIFAGTNARQTLTTSPRCTRTYTFQKRSTRRGGFYLDSWLLR